MFVHTPFSFWIICKVHDYINLLSQFAKHCSISYNSLLFHTKYVTFEMVVQKQLQKCLLAPEPSNRNYYFPAIYAIFYFTCFKNQIKIPNIAIFGFFEYFSNSSYRINYTLFWYRKTDCITVGYGSSTMVDEVKGVSNLRRMPFRIMGYVIYRQTVR